MEKPIRAADGPIATPVEAGKTYYWCACGRSQKQPFCNGSHAGTGFSPVKYDAMSTKTVYFCGCKDTKKPPLCDGSHEG